MTDSSSALSERQIIEAGTCPSPSVARPERPPGGRLSAGPRPRRAGPDHRGLPLALVEDAAAPSRAAREPDGRRPDRGRDASCLSARSHHEAGHRTSHRRAFSPWRPYSVSGTCWSTKQMRPCRTGTWTRSKSSRSIARPRAGRSPMAIYSARKHQRALNEHDRLAEGQGQRRVPRGKTSHG